MYKYSVINSRYKYSQHLETYKTNLQYNCTVNKSNSNHKSNNKCIQMIYNLNKK